MVSFLVEEVVNAAAGGRAGESLWDEVLPVEVRELPEDLGRWMCCLRDAALLEPIRRRWQRRRVRSWSPDDRRWPTFVRLMVIKQRTGWGYETLVREVSDSMHLRRFCLIALGERVPDESTVRKLTRRLGAGVVNEMTAVVIDKATAGEAVSAAGGAGSTRRWSRRMCAIRPTRGWRGRGSGAGARGAQAAGEGRPGRGPGPGSHASDRPPGAGDDPHDRAGGPGSASSRCWS